MSKLQQFQQWFQRSGGYFLDQALVSGGSFALTILLGRDLGPEGFGVFSLGWMGLLFINSLQQAFILTPMLSLYPGRGSVYLKGLAQIQAALLGVTLAIGGLLFLLSRLWPMDALFVDLIVPVTAASIGHQLYDFSRKVMLVRQDLKGVQRFDALVIGLQLFLLLTCWHLDLLNPIFAFYPLALAYGLPAIFPILKLVLDRSHPVLPDLLKDHWSYGGWLLATALMQWFSGNYFLITGAALLGPIAMGAIRMAQTIMGLLNVFLLALENFVPVRAALALDQGGMPAVRQYIRRIGLQSGLVYFPILGLIALLAPFLTQLFFGAAYLPYAPVLQGFALLYCFVFLGTLLRYVYRTLGTTREIFIGYLLSTLGGLALAHPFVSTWGITGIVAGMLLCQLLICGWLWIRLPFPKMILDK